MQKQKILITGVDGFIGKYLFAELKNRGIDVSGVSKKELDICDKESVNKFFQNKKFDIIFHLAALVSQKDEDFQNLFSVNCFGTENLLKAAVKNGVKKFIYSSSSSVYSRSEGKIPFKESFACPDSIYGVSKLAGENLCEIYRKNYGLQTISLRYASVFGYLQKENSVVPIFISNVLDGKNIQIFGRGVRTQDFIYVKDVVSANIKAAESKRTGIFNIGSGKEVSIVELARKISKIFLQNKCDAQHIIVSKEDKSKGCLDISKAKNILKFFPEYSLDKGLEDYKRSIYENRNNI